MKTLDAERLLTRVGQHMWREYKRRIPESSVKELAALYEAAECIWELKREIRRELRRSGK